MRKVGTFLGGLLIAGVLWTLVNLWDCWGYAPTIFSFFGNGC